MTARKRASPAAALAALISCSGGSNMADKIFINAKFLTLDPARPSAEALASRKGEIVAVGTAAEIRKLAGPGTETIDLGGGVVLPGFIDSHVHFVNGGFSLTSVQLRDAGVQGGVRPPDRRRRPRACRKGSGS